jgi:hypothetical protein
MYRFHARAVRIRLQTKHQRFPQYFAVSFPPACSSVEQQ